MLSPAEHEQAPPGSADLIDALANEAHRRIVTGALMLVSAAYLVMFAIVFFWQFPHFYSIAWLYRQDYEDGGIRMLPVVESDGKSTGRQILIYSFVLIPISLLPAFLGMSGKLYLAGALALGTALLCVGWRLATLKVAPTTARSKQRARQLLQATVIYLPLLFALMMLNPKS